MPDRRSHRGPHPEDVRLFDTAALGTLRAAATDLCWLLDRGYPHESSLKLVGNRYSLLSRQRIAVSRCCCSAAQAARRRDHEVDRTQLPDAALWLDGYNVLTTIEAALAGGVILAGRDGAYRDMASMHGSYRKVVETLPAIDLLGRTLAECRLTESQWLLDRPVSNSGRLKGMIEQLAAAHGWPWRVELVPDPDAILADPALTPQPQALRVIVASADSAILDRCPAWFNLARETIRTYLPSARLVELAGM